MCDISIECEIFVAVQYFGELKVKLEDRSQKKKDNVFA